MLLNGQTSTTAQCTKTHRRRTKTTTGAAGLCNAKIFSSSFCISGSSTTSSYSAFQSVDSNIFSCVLVPSYLSVLRP